MLSSSYFIIGPTVLLFSFLSLALPADYTASLFGGALGFLLMREQRIRQCPPPGSFLTSSGKGSYSSKMSISLWLVQQENMSDITKPGTGGTKTHSSLLTVKAWALSTKSLSLSLF